MNGHKTRRALAARRKVFMDDKLSPEHGFNMPGSQNPRKGYAAEAENPVKMVRKSPQGGGNPSRRARKVETKSGPGGELRKRIRGLTRGAKNKARKEAGWRD